MVVADTKIMNPLILTLLCPSSVIHSQAEDHVITSEQLPFVCQTIEVTTENEEQTVSSSHPYPLQISPVSMCGGKTATTAPRHILLQGET